MSNKENENYKEVLAINISTSINNARNAELSLSIMDIAFILKSCFSTEELEALINGLELINK